MNQDCEVIQDLISMGRKASKASTKMIMDHIRECDRCRMYYQATRKGWRPRPRINIEAAPRDTQMRYFNWSLTALSLLTTSVCMSVNYAVDKQLSWGWIVAGALACSTLPVFVYLRTYTNRFLKALLCFSAMVFLLLGLIQYVLYNIMGSGGVWIWRVAVPVTAIWLVALWSGILLAKFKDLNGFYCIGMILLMTIPADIATEAIAVAYTGDTFIIHWSNLAVYLMAALVCFAAGVVFDMRGKQNK